MPQQSYEVVVHFRDDTSYDETIEAPSPIHAIEVALRRPEVWQYAYNVTNVEVA